MPTPTRSLLLLAALLTLAPAAHALPTVRITSPQVNAVVDPAAGLPLTAEAASPDGPVVKVDFFDNGRLVGTVTQPPFALLYHPAAPPLNFSLTARATDAAGHAALSPPVTCVTLRPVQRHYRSYDYQETAENLLKQVRVTIPEGLTTVRGLVLVSNAAGDDSRDRYREAWYGEFLHLHDFAFVGTKNFTSHVASFTVLQHALQQIAPDSAHPELVNVPYVTTGFSAGGGFASRLVVEAPDRVIAAVIVSSRLNLTGMTPGPAHLRTPVLITSGEQESNFASVIDPVLAYRPQGALYAWMTIQGTGHGRVGQEVIAMPMLEAALRLRYPEAGDVRQGPLTLKTLTPESGWVADNTTWHSGLTTIAPAAQFTGDLAKSSWLLNQDIAYIYRAYATYDRPLTLTSPVTAPDRVWDPGSNVTLVVDATGFPQWKKLAFYDGVRLLGEITSGPPQFTAPNLTPGDHAFSVLGTDPQGQQRPSNPVLVVVRKLPPPPAVTPAP